MSIIPEEYRRVLEERVDATMVRHSSSVDGFTSWLFGIAFGGRKLLAVESVTAHKHRDFRVLSGDKLAYGETDIELVARLETPDGRQITSALLIEDKVDAREMPAQGLRYQARARHERSIGSWQEYACVLLAPQSYLDSHYPLGDSKQSGWDHLLSLEDVAAQIPDSADAGVLLEAAQAANSWNKPIPAAVQFWEDFRQFGRARYSTVPVFVDTQQGSRVGGVWPSFYDNQLRRNSHEPRRKRVQIVHMDTADYVCLFIKKVDFGAFAAAVNLILEQGMTVAPPGTSWQSIRIQTGRVNPLQPLDLQITTLNKVFEAARRFYEFYLSHENAFLGISTRP
jgi:hypothetical protein